MSIEKIKKVIGRYRQITLSQNCHSGPDFHRDKLQPESRVPGENRDPVFEMVPDFRRDDVWMPPYQVRGRLLASGMTEMAVYRQTLFSGFSS